LSFLSVSQVLLLAHPLLLEEVFSTSLPIPTSLVIFHLTAQDCNKQKFNELQDCAEIFLKLSHFS
jgi:exonuclease I